MKSCIAVFVCLIASSGLGLAHGEENLGPHKGYIRMSSAFHTEVVPQGADQIRVYLLDMNWQNPSVKGSSLKVQISGGKPQSAAKCSAQSDFYLCSFTKGTDLTHGKLIIEATREKQSGIPVSYDLPLRLENPHEMSH